MLTIPAANVSGAATLNGIPLLISITDADLTTVAAKVTDANGFDIAFMDDNNQLLPHELMSYNGTTGALLAWVRVTNLYGSFNTDIQMVYGNSSITTDQSTSATWDSDYEAVLHLQEIR